MTLVPDEYVLAPATEAEFGPFILAELPMATFRSDCFDLFADVPGSKIVPIETAYRIARAMRGGADPDTTRPSDWHVRSLQPIHDIPERAKDGEGPWPVVGTAIWFSRSYTLPEGYDEGETTGRTPPTSGPAA